MFGEFEEWEPATPRGGHRRTAPIYVRGSPDEPTPGRLPPGTANLDLNLDTSPPPASHTGRDALHELRAKLREPGRLREAVVMREILDRPLGLRRPARRSFRDR